MKKSTINKKDASLTNPFDEMFADIFGKGFPTELNWPVTPKSYTAKPNVWQTIDNTTAVLYKWVDENNLFIGAPGISKDDLKIDNIVDNRLILCWDTEYSVCKNLVVPLPDGTKNVDINVINGLIILTFEKNASDISVTIK